MRCQEEKQPAASIDGDVWYVADIEEVKPFHWVNRCRTACSPILSPWDKCYLIGQVDPAPTCVVPTIQETCKGEFYVCGAYIPSLSEMLLTALGPLLYKVNKQ